ncbi:UDP-N-acetylmuramoyl-L-alanyl-D-glutamate--2,6-diaminopimelate ligase [Sinanaerobacter chloroacetimidivorans]|uniref:UDP-N-acetylmuramoyl-L-alanyl-D-glutamate--2,6-diaminopimelate ligase n=1 Tax=Sinanaerobacter chloroacetimidivorans TaxID=2818044 RepID=A0A8J8B0D5_9FIRM|nr:UDP-N-acetylmuramoyl-L-alanyl-D-glutamate--2,6-diaminopimelate ligase [Sinanaerobacter chloroacetimidivorans]MBR0597069.1 UDP-N-acetylmuramoyl-L-alanyl-D-glutamate--2,6-diaminopimelate ligase [Sinanaerobacter chloroacetimidivorans]
MKLIHLLHGTDEKCPENFEDIEVTGVTNHSRQIEKGNAFVCIRGYHTDGHIYAADAASRGASVIICEEDPGRVSTPVLQVQDTRKILSKLALNFYGDPSKKVHLYGVTGTNGKTTITYMMQSILEADGKTCGLLGTIGYRFGQRKYEAVNTTPESCDLQKMFYEMKSEGIEHCVMEVSSHALAMGRVDDIHYEYGIFTNLTPDHMDFHNSTEEYFIAKKKLFYLTEKANVINLDDEHGKRLYHELKETRPETVTLGYSLKDRKAEYYGEILETTEKGSIINVIEHMDKTESLKLNTPGIFTIYNGLAALACARAAGISCSTVQKGLESLKGVPGRFELVENSKGKLVIVDYAHTPDALEKVLKTASEFKKGRLICVFGCGGDRDRKKRALMGAAAGKYSDYCIITSDNPRSEKQEDIAAEIEAGIYDTGCRYEIIENRYEAIKKAVSICQKGDIIMIAGKGHETYQIIGAKKFHFDDREVVKKIIEDGE